MSSATTFNKIRLIIFDIIIIGGNLSQIQVKGKIKCHLVIEENSLYRTLLYRPNSIFRPVFTYLQNESTQKTKTKKRRKCDLLASLFDHTFFFSANRPHSIVQSLVTAQKSPFKDQP